MFWHLKRGGGRLDYSLPGNDAKYASRKFGLKLDRHCKRRRVLSADGKAKFVTPRPGALVARPRGAKGGCSKWRYGSVRSQVAKRLRGGVKRPRAVELAARRGWHAEWEAMSLDEKLEWERLNIEPLLDNDAANEIPDPPPREMDILDLLAGDDDEGAMPSYASSSRESFPPDIGDDFWPLAEDVFTEHMASFAQRFGFSEWRGGVVRVGSACREELRQHICIDSDPRLKPTLKVPVPCWVRHLGLCIGRDAAVYDDALALAARVHHELKAAPPGSFLGFHTIRYSRLFCFCLMRLRDPELAVFAECSINGRVGIDQVITLDVSPHGEFVFSTAYSIARDIMVALAGDRHEVCLTKYAVASDRATPFSVRVRDRAYTVLREADRAGGGDDDADEGGGHDDDDRYGDDRGEDGGGGEDEGGDLLDMIVAAEQAAGPRRRRAGHGDGLRVAPAVPRPAVVALDDNDGGCSDLPEDDSVCLSDDVAFAGDPDGGGEDGPGDLLDDAVALVVPPDDVGGGDDGPGDLIDDVVALVPPDGGGGDNADSDRGGGCPGGRDEEADVDRGPQVEDHEVGPVPAPVVGVADIDAELDPEHGARRCGPDGWPRLYYGSGYLRLSRDRDGSWDFRSVCEFCEAMRGHTRQSCLQGAICRRFHVAK